jgi:hypothetical protein
MEIINDDFFDFNTYKILRFHSKFISNGNSLLILPLEGKIRISVTYLYKNILFSFMSKNNEFPLVITKTSITSGCSKQVFNSKIYLIRNNGEFCLAWDEEQFVETHIEILLVIPITNQINSSYRPLSNLSLYNDVISGKETYNSVKVKLLDYIIYIHPHILNTNDYFKTLFLYQTKNEYTLNQKKFIMDIILYHIYVSEDEPGWLKNIDEINIEDINELLDVSNYMFLPCIKKYLKKHIQKLDYPLSHKIQLIQFYELYDLLNYNLILLILNDSIKEIIDEFNKDLLIIIISIYTKIVNADCITNFSFPDYFPI